MQMNNRCVALVLLGIIFFSLFSVYSLALKEDKETQLEKLQGNHKNKPIVKWNEKTKSPKLILNFRYEMKEGKIRDEKKANSVFNKFLSQNKKLLNIKPSDLKLKSIRNHDNNWYIVAQQYHKGVPVYEATVGLTMSDDGIVRRTGSNFHQDIECDSKPKITKKDLIEILRKDIPSINDAVVNMSLMIFPIEDKSSLEYKLVWLVGVFSENPPLMEQYLVDAIDGGIILKFDSVKRSAMRIKGDVKGPIKPSSPSNNSVNEEFDSIYLYVNDKDFDIDSADCKPHFGCDDDQLGSTPYITDTSNEYGFDTGDISNEYGIVDGDDTNDPEAEIYLASLLKGPHIYVVNAHGGFTGHLNGDYIDANYDFGGHIVSDKIQDVWFLNSLEENNVYYHATKTFRFFNGSPFNFNEMEYGMRAIVDTGYDKMAPSAATPLLALATPCWMWFHESSIAALISDAIIHEYSHCVVYTLLDNQFIRGISTCKDENEFKEACAMDEAIADYYAASINDDPFVEVTPSHSSRDLRNDTTYQEKNGIPHHDGLILSTTLWDLHEDPDVGASVADYLIFKAMMETPHPRTFFEFYTALLEVDREYYSGNNINDIEEAFFVHGINYILTIPDSTIGSVAQGNTWEALLAVPNIGEKTLVVDLSWITHDDLDLSLELPNGTTVNAVGNHPERVVISTPPKGSYNIKVYGDFVFPLFTNFRIDVSADSPPIITDIAGINFSDIRINFVANCDPNIKGGLTVNLRGTKAGVDEVILDTAGKSSMSTDAFLAGLVVPNQDQWIGLFFNNAQYGGRFGQTEAGQTLFEMDEKMKWDLFNITQSLLIDMMGVWIDIVNSSELYDKWMMSGFNGFPQPSMVAEIVPDTFVINGTSCGDMYVEDVNLKINMRVSVTSVDDYSGLLTIERSLLIPLFAEWQSDLESELSNYTTYMEDLLNNHDNYSDLRRVYAAIATARWYKDEVPRHTSIFGDLMDSNDLEAVNIDVPDNKAYWDDKSYQLLYYFSFPTFRAEEEKVGEVWI